MSAWCLERHAGPVVAFFELSELARPSGGKPAARSRDAHPVGRPRMALREMDDDASHGARHAPAYLDELQAQRGGTRPVVKQSFDVEPQLLQEGVGRGGEDEPELVGVE